MSTELSVSLPHEAVIIKSEIEKLQLIQVIDDQTNIAASENLKFVSKGLKNFIDACEPKRIELRTPVDQFLGLIKGGRDQIENWINAQKKEIGGYAKKIMDEENEKRRVEQERQNAINSFSAEPGEAVEKVQEPVRVEQAKVKSEFVNTNVKLKPKGSVVDLPVFIQSLIETGKTEWINSILKVNESKLNDFCEAMKLDGEKSKYPGLSVELVPDVRVR